MTKPLLAEGFSIPTASQVDGRLIGVRSYLAWVGRCLGIAQGHSIASLAYLEPKAFGFVGAMLVGFKLADWLAPSEVTGAMPIIIEARRFIRPRYPACRLLGRAACIDQVCQRPVLYRWLGQHRL